MPRPLLLLVLLLLPGLAARAQQAPTWMLLPDSPFHDYRSEDVFFTDPDHGWAVNGSGEVWRTLDGGETWDFAALGGGYLRSAGFATDQIGWIGVLFSAVQLYETRDGGLTLTNVTSRIHPAVAGGICGLWVVNDQVAYGVGQYSGPAYLIKTTDGGQTWTSVDLSPYADTAVDVFFLDEQHGFVAAGVGGLGPSSRVRVLETEDGGQTWSVRHTSTLSGVWGWKLSFPTPEVGYVSAEYEGSASNSLVLKTTDGGQTWSELTIPGGGSLQGIGFLTPDVGWASGRGQTSVTTDGGQTWHQIGLDGDINRFRFLGDTLGYAAGHNIYKLEATPTAAEAPPVAAAGLVSVAPNPADGPLTATYRLAQAGSVELVVYDFLGRAVVAVAAGLRNAGEHAERVDLRAAGAAPGVYLVRLRTSDGAWVRTVTLLPR